ncbi:ParB/RepB/Spo0J family partition protein [Pseudomonas aeruginosa]|uniref:ParB/RepB/Spo0J family partition protein n=1 Tax=Pseudomonas aeruginosa TaxID=287 RepID=UPI001048CECD|nr:ParB/RepB/Spo0J family partition protein [Pseudomonas aeruginosa]
MNAVLKTEAVAIEAAAPLEMADPSKNLILVPLSQLLPRRSKRNARKMPRLSIPELAASIARIGLLQNLIVILSADGEAYEVVAGDRRLTALKLLAKKKRIPADYEVPCLLVPDASARTVSLAENLMREQMHPADQFEAFAALVKEGRPIEDIAADFGVSPLVVQRRLKLAHIAPRLMADYRAGTVTLEQLMALTITDDHAAQEAAFFGAPEWQRSPSKLRERLTEREIDASHALVRFVGLDTYRQAGGGVRRDLFAEGDAGTYLTDTAVLETLVRDKLATLAEDVRAEGWAAHRTAALQIEVARHPHVALAALVHGMVQTVLQPDAYGDGLPLGVRLTAQDRLEGMAPDWPESPAAVALRELQQVAGEALPEDSAELLAVLLAKSQDELVRLLAVCVASTVDVVTPRATAHQPGEELAQAVGLDMAAWWKPTAEGYFKHVSKAVILDAVGAFAPESVTRLAKLKKADIASEAERLADGTGWMPAIFKAAGPQNAAQEAGPEQDAPEDAEAMADEPAEALAA